MNALDTSPPTLVERWFIPFDLLMITSVIVTIILACVFILIIVLDQTCHTVPMVLVATTCFAQLLASVAALSQNIITSQNDLHRTQYQDPLCAFRGYFIYVSTAMMNYSFLLQATHRCMTAIYPTRLFWQSRRTQSVLICAASLFCLLFPLAFLITGDIIYNASNQICQIPLGLNFPIIFMAFFIYVCPVSAIIFLYLRLVLYVKAMSSRVTSVNILFRAQRELKMVQQIVILVSILLTLGMPYFIFVWISFFTEPPKYHLRLAWIFIEAAFPCLSFTLLYFTDPLKESVKKIFPRRTNVVMVGTI